VACLVAGAFLMAGISAYLLLKDKGTQIARKTLKVALIFGLVFSMMSLYPSGHHHAKQVAHEQPEKFAAMEGLIRGQSRAPMVLFGKPSDDPPKMEFVFEVPGLLSWMAFGNADAPIQGIEDLRASGWPTPPLVPTFLSFHAMVGLGLLFIALTAFGVFLLVRKGLYQRRWYLRLLLWSIPLPLVACQLGWIVAEVGRQPWVVYRLLKTSDAFSQNVAAGEILFSIIMFGTVYLLLGVLYLFILVKKIKQGPQPLDVKEA